MTETLTIGLTGAAGYIGSRVMHNLRDAGHDIVAVDDFSAAKVESVDGQEIIDGDIRDEELLESQFTDVDILLHLAAESGVQACDENPDRAFDVNVRGTETVAWFCRQHDVPLVFPCSMAIVGEPVEFPISATHPRDPVNMYGLTKKMSEADIQDLARDAYPAHVYMKSNLYGHHEAGGERVGKRTVINIFVERALEDKTLSVHEPGTQARDFIHVKDVARAYERSIETLLDDAEPGATTIPLASGEDMSVLDLANLVQGVCEEERGYAPPVELVENPRGEEAAGSDFSVDTSRAAETIGFEAEHTVEETVRAMLSEAE
ncbi:MAG: NAD-dependent epimerase/dehydratase family protein [Halolamina sp.]|uniref:NAD-dependent epimerase/dehydratase family protein n=1 Tax=Halolamina sp. TaxID=1940283 RepID=UPI002FC39A29